MKIMIVDDREDSAALLARQLSVLGHESTTVSNGLQALDLLASVRPGMIISDILMPGMDGFRLCSNLKEDPVLRSIPFVFYTAAYTDPRDAEFALSIGARRLLVRPLSTADLGKVIDEVAETSVSEQGVEGGIANHLQQYSERLVAKLESTVEELEATNRRLHAEVAETKRLQEQVRRSERLAAVGELAAVIAHEVRNPLGAIGNCVGVLRKKAGLAGTSAELLEIISEETGRLNALVENLLAFARPTPVRCRPTDILALLVSLVEVLTKSGQIPQCVQVNSLHPSSLPHINVDPDQMRQVFLNLITNALQAMPGGGELRIETTLVPMDEDVPGVRSRGRRGVEVVVRDTGEGMAQEAQINCFEPFYTTRASGSGLGLAIVRRILEAHNGSIGLSSSPGVGTAVKVTLPVGGHA